MSNDYDDQPGPSGRSGPSASLIGLVIVAAVSVSFVLQNRRRTRIDFLFFDFNSRVWTAIVVAIALGIILDRLILMWWRRARKNR